MTRRLHLCITCPGKTRHRAVCGPCRRRGITVVGDQITVPLEQRTPTLRLLPNPPADPNAPTLAELRASVDLTPFVSWPIGGGHS